MKVTVKPIIFGALREVPKDLFKRTGGSRNWMTSWDDLNNGIVEVGLNSEKSPEDSRRIAFTKTPHWNQRRTLVWKTLKIVK